MAGMQFEYDEKGGTFYYFLLSFFALVLIPATYYLWPRKTSKEEPEKNKRQCYCEPCQTKRHLLRFNEPWANTKKNTIKIVLFIGWIIFIFIAYKTSQVELDFSEFDPFSELGIDRGASNSVIKKAYHKLSLKYHPDKPDGDPNRFMKITKAYQALTDDEARKNWEEYGNPDGPGATHFGIALPKWIVEKQNSVWVLAVYGLVFMVLLPVIVGTWWYRSIKYSAEQILMDTTQLYYYFFHKTPNMIVKRVLMILGASMEFEKSHNSEVTERPSDNEEIPSLMRELPQLNEKNKEKPLCFPYSVKARALIHAHLSRLDLPPKTLEIDRQYLIKKCPYLINEMINIVAHLVALAHAGRATHMPRLDTIENCMKVSQMVVQALWENKSPLLQLPHVSEDMLRHFTTKRRNIRNIIQFVRMKEDDRRQLLRSLNDDEYHDVINMCSSLPNIVMTVTSEVLDDEDKTITAGSIVTVTVKLSREVMGSLLDSIQSINEANGAVVPSHKEAVEEVEKEAEEEGQPESPVRKPKAWEKPKKKKGKGGKNKKKPVKNTIVKKQPVTNVGPSAPVEGKESKDSKDSPLFPGKQKSSRRRDESQSTDEDSAISTDGEGDINAEEEGEDIIEDDEEDWKKFQEEAKKENVLETKSKETHAVHCPYFPAMKYEWWWLYVADRRQHLLITAPVQVTSLKDEEEIQLKFSAPQKPGMYEYTVCLRSDSFLDFDHFHRFKLDVKEHKKVENHPQWDISEDEDDKADGDLTESEGSSEFDESDDE